VKKGMAAIKKLIIEIKVNPLDESSPLKYKFIYEN